MRIGIIDLGSNTIRLVVYFWNGKKLEKKHNIKRQAQSAKYIEDGTMSKVGVETIISNLKELLMIARTHDVTETRIFATASLRNIRNADAVKVQIESAINQKIDVLNGNDESLFGFEGMKRTVELPLEGVSVDVGGGSTEITHFSHGQAIHSISIPVGSLNLYLNHVQDVLPTEGELMLMRIEVQNALNQIEWLKKIHVDTLIGIGGSARAIMRLHQARYDIQASIYDMQLSQVIFNAYLVEAGSRSKELSSLIVNNIPERLTTLIPGSLILYEVMKMISAESYKLSSYGVREGYFFKRVLNHKDA